MKTEHTPGPWHYVVSHEGFLGQPENEMKEFFSIMQTRNGNGPNACIAEIEEGTETHKFSDNYLHRITKEVAEANAKLIAAAPELLDALQLARNILHQKYNYTALEYFDNIIEKAKGKSQ